ncbi:hypothetical protein BpHYR1_029094 [Brachionus plicatilis]|uniref:Uncharacterized protein n=1 Tax=Brachionus plicatilis TaxID=10195 RepID=A0A3M7Q4T1_BRAPC|nr:hypothetical protein BpHYR1_029094 [Brachionus plicatilis]
MHLSDSDKSFSHVTSSSNDMRSKFKPIREMTNSTDETSLSAGSNGVAFLDKFANANNQVIDVNKTVRGSKKQRAKKTGIFKSITCQVLQILESLYLTNNTVPIPGPIV